MRGLQALVGWAPDKLTVQRPGERRQNVPGVEEFISEVSVREQTLQTPVREENGEDFLEPAVLKYPGILVSYPTDSAM